jgi:hypothetical protein
VSPTLLLAALAVALVALDAGLRRLGCYASTSQAWPAGWRALPPERGGPSPYRHAGKEGWAIAVDAGIPPAVSVFLPPVLVLFLLWMFGVVAGTLDLADVVRGTRSFGFWLSSMLLCVTRAIAGGATLSAAIERSRRDFFVASAVALALDTALVLFPLPCTDHRYEDVGVALANAAAQSALLLGFTISVWRRRGLMERVEAAPEEPEEVEDLDAPEM